MKSEYSKAWNAFFHSEVDNRVFAFLRISFGVVLILYALVLGPDWIRWFGDDGVLGKEEIRQNIDSDTWSVLLWLPGTETTLHLVFGIICLQILLFCIGWHTRLQTICLFVWILSLHHRNNLIWEGGDIVIRVSFFLFIFMPLGARWSLDWLLSGREKNETSPVWALRLLQLQQSFLYFSSVGQKLRGYDWTSGEAFYYVTRLEDFSNPLLSRLLPEGNLWIYQLVTWGSIAIEMLLIWAVWVPSLRRKAVALGILFHVGIELSMNLFVFQWLMIFILCTHFFSSRSNSVRTEEKQLKDLHSSRAEQASSSNTER